VLEVGVIGLPVPVHGERVVAFVVLREDRIASESELREHARTRLTDYKVPEKIVFVPQLPKGMTRKVQRRSLKEMATAAAA